MKKNDEIQEFKQLMCDSWNKMSTNYGWLECRFELKPSTITIGKLTPEVRKDIIQEDGNLEDYELVYTHLRVEFRKKKKE